MNKTDKQAIADFEAYHRSLLAGVSVTNNDPVFIDKHRKELESDIISWINFFFPKYAKYPFAPFHIKFLSRIKNNAEWYEVLSWSRELSKSTTTMFAIMYLALTGQKKNIVIASSSEDNAERLLAPYKVNLEKNERIKAYYGEQVAYGSWESSEFITRNGVAFRGIGAGNAPRGSKNEEIRPDVINCDDFDTDEATRNPETVKKNWDWFEQALYPTRSISEPVLIIWCGNIISKDCCITRAGKMADHWDIVNIRDKEGKSTWAAKNTEANIDRVLSKISFRSAQQEYFNNPVVDGTIFKEITWGKVPKLKELDFAVIYADPSTSNKDKATKTKGVSYKSCFLLGNKNGKFYIYTGFLDQTSNSKFINWFYVLNDKCKGKTQVYNYIENNTLQDPFFEQVFKPLFEEVGEKEGYLSIIGDDRKKPDKFVRIEGNLEPLNRNGQLIFNIDEQDNPNMQRLADQFLGVNPQLSYPSDGPDCIEGGVWKINEKIRQLSFQPITGKRKIKNEW